MSAGRLLRTLRHLRPRQAAAQLRYQLTGPPSPVSLPGPAPSLGLSTPAAPFLPAPAHARFDGAGRIQLIGREVAFPDRIDWDFSGQGPLWSFHLHQFDFARGSALEAGARGGLLLDWIERHPRGVGWNPHPISLRILSWGKLLLSPGALELDAEELARVRHSLACQIETLARNPEHRLQANHLLSNYLGVVFGGMLFQGALADGWLRREAALRAELEVQIGGDGGHQERSPMYHSLLLENLLDLLNLARAAPERAPVALRQKLEQSCSAMLGALQVWTHPDGEIALFGDSAFEIAHPPAALAAYAAALGVEPRGPERLGVLDACGFVRLESPPFVLIASVAGPMPVHQPGHAHCDALAFELSVGEERVITDTGVPEYIPGPLRELCRATRSHATIEVDDRDQAEVWHSHRAGGRPRVRLERVDPLRRAEASCAGWATRASLHRRAFALDGRGVEILDRIEGRPLPVRLALPLAPGLEPELAPGGARLSLPGGRRIRVALPSGGELAWSLRRAPYFPRFGTRVERACLVGEAPSFHSGRWRFELE